MKEGEGRGGEAFAGGGVRADSMDKSIGTRLKSIRILGIRHRQRLFPRFQNGFARTVGRNVVLLDGGRVLTRIVFSLLVHNSI